MATTVDSQMRVQTFRFSITALAVTAQLAMAAIVTWLSVASRDLSPMSINQTTLITALSISFSLALTLITVALYVRRLPRTHLAIAYFLMSILALLSLGFSLYALVTVWIQASAAIGFDSIKRVDEIGIALWGVVLCSQAAFFVAMLYCKGEEATMGDIEALAQPSSQSVEARKLRSPSVRLAGLTATAFPHRSASDPVFPTLQPNTSSSTSTSTPTNSMAQIMRPVTSKTNLLMSSPFEPGEPNLFQPCQDHSPHIGLGIGLRRDDGFEDWDTSRVEELQDSLYFSKRTKTILEPIPGSEPTSPVKAVDVSLPAKIKNNKGKQALVQQENRPLPDSPTLREVTGRDSPESRTASPMIPPPFAISPSPSPPGRDHIHPLFRYEGRGFTPVASPGSTMTGSPMGGRIVGRDIALSYSRRSLTSPESFTGSPGTTRSGATLRRESSSGSFA